MLTRFFYCNNGSRKRGITKSMFMEFCSVDQNNFSNFGRGSPKVHFCEIIMKSGHLPRRRYHLKGFLFLALAAILFRGAEKF